MIKEYFLTDEQIELVKIEWMKEYQHHGDGCLCGCYSCNIEGFGCLSIDVSCRKSSSCPDGMSWYVHEDINIYNKSIVDDYGCEYTWDEFEEKGIKHLGKLNKEQTNELREVVRKAIIRDYSAWGYDEYGNNPNDEMYKNDDTLYTLKEIKEALKEAETTEKDIFDILKENKIIR